MNLVSDDSRIFSPILITVVYGLGQNIQGSSETKFMNLPPYIFDVDYVAKIRFWPSITVLEKKLHKITA